ncbi:hypothetical protein AB0F72_09445 [Actinoplanes sp. NPDC023936]|uniref:hypothetical protein n=1 Tax=Actinoplanes sp. NPDC023936 TaxID=3154910 RepID=UPI0033D6ABE5
MSDWLRGAGFGLLAMYALAAGSLVASVVAALWAGRPGRGRRRVRTAVKQEMAQHRVIPLQRDPFWHEFIDSRPGGDER